MKIIFFLALNLIVLMSICQVPPSELNKQDKKFFQTITDVSNYLRAHKTVPLVFHESPSCSKDEAFYDTVITKFVSKEKMLKIFEKDTSHLSVAGKVDWMRHILNEADYYLDIIPSIQFLSDLIIRKNYQILLKFT